MNSLDEVRKKITARSNESTASLSCGLSKQKRDSISELEVQMRRRKAERDAEYDTRFESFF